MQVAPRDALHAQVLGPLGGVARKLEDLSGEVLEDGGRVDDSDGANAAIVGDAQLEVAVDATDGELEASLGRAGDRLLGLQLAPWIATISRMIDCEEEGGERGGSVCCCGVGWCARSDGARQSGGRWWVRQTGCAPKLCGSGAMQSGRICLGIVEVGGAVSWRRCSNKSHGRVAWGRADKAENKRDIHLAERVLRQVPQIK